MHFYYLDESGDTGSNLNDPDQPVIVLGGISVRDEGWNETQKHLEAKLSAFFDGTLPAHFELHAKDLLCPSGAGAFSGFTLRDRARLCHSILDVLAERSHSTHYIALDKRRIRESSPSLSVPFDPKQPYLLAFDYLVTFANWHLKERLGRSARGLIILDQKEQYHSDVERIMRDRRFGGPATHRVKWVVEFSYPVDSRKNPMIQLSDLVVYCVKRFMEIHHGYRDGWSSEAKKFYAECFAKIHPRLPRSTLVAREGRGMDEVNSFIQEVRLEPRQRWKNEIQKG